MKHFTCLLALLVFFYPAHTQQVTKEFNRLLVDEDFTNLNNKWDQQSNSDNSFIGLTQGFQTWRKNEKSGFFIFPQKKQEYSVFETSVNFTFNSKGGKNQSAGLVLQAQDDGTGAVLIEINKKKQYRIMRAFNNRLVPISGEGDGWMKGKKAITSSENTVMLRTYDKIYDLYINDKYITSFTEIEYSRGQIGLYIGANSMAVFHRFIVKTDDDHVGDDSPKPGSIDEEKTLSQVIVKLKETINKKDKRILELENEVRGMNGRSIADSNILRQKADLENRLIACNRELETLKSENYILNSKLKELEEFKRLITQNENGDIIINLSNLTAEQKKQIEGLQSQVKQLNSILEQTKQEKADLQNLLNQRNAENDELRNEKIILMQRLLEKDSIIAELEEKVTLLDDALTQCNKRSGNGSGRKKQPKQQQGDAILFDE